MSRPYGIVAEEDVASLALLSKIGSRHAQEIPEDDGTTTRLLTGGHIAL